VNSFPLSWSLIFVSSCIQVHWMSSRFELLANSYQTRGIVGVVGISFLAIGVLGYIYFLGKIEEILDTFKNESTVSQRFPSSHSQDTILLSIRLDFQRLFFYSAGPGPI
jgi:predicted ferric reductase